MHIKLLSSHRSPTVISYMWMLVRDKNMLSLLVDCISLCIFTDSSYNTNRKKIVMILFCVFEMLGLKLIVHNSQWFLMKSKKVCAVAKVDSNIISAIEKVGKILSLINETLEDPRNANNPWYLAHFNKPINLWPRKLVSSHFPWLCQVKWYMLPPRNQINRWTMCSTSAVISDPDSADWHTSPRCSSLMRLYL